VFLFAAGMSACRRSVELDHDPLQSRVSLTKYTRRNLFIIKLAGLIGIWLLWMLGRPLFQLPYVVTFSAYLTFVGGIDLVPAVRLAFAKLWQN
jgi:hypothetical protein